MKYLASALILLFFVSCKSKTVQNNGGLVIKLGFTNAQITCETLNSTLEVIKKRAETSSDYPPTVFLDSADNTIIVQLALQEKSTFDPRVFTSPGNFSILETYSNSDIYEALEKLNAHIIESFSKANILDEMVEQKTLFEILFLTGTQYQNNPMIGIIAESDIDHLDSLLNLPLAKDLLPRNFSYMYGKAKEGNREVFGIKHNGTDVIIDNSMIEKATKEFEPHQAKFVISLKFKTEYHKLWAKMTRLNIGKALAVTFENEVYMAPFVQAEIIGGNVHISGSFDVEEAETMEAILNHGSLPAALEIHSVEEYKPGELK